LTLSRRDTKNWLPAALLAREHPWLICRTDNILTWYLSHCNYRLSVSCIIYVEVLGVSQYRRDNAKGLKCCFSTFWKFTVQSVVVTKSLSD